MSGGTHTSSRRASMLRWPLGVLLTGWTYLWRTTPLKRREREGSWPEDAPPDVDDRVDRDEVQRQQDGVGTMMRRRYRAVIRDAAVSAEELMRDLQSDPNAVAPGTLAHFQKTRGEHGAMAVGDEYQIRMPGPWDGPVRVADLTPTSFRFVTLNGHIEAGQIEWRARDEDGRLVFEIESWSRPGDRMSAIMHHTLRMAKEVQLHMWTTVLEEVVDVSGGRRDGPLDLDTRLVPDAPTDDAG